MANKENKKQNVTPQPEQKKAKKKEKVEKPVSRPTVQLRQSKILENLGSNKKPVKGGIGISGAAKKAGYSESYARSGQIQKTKSWKALLEEYLPESKLLKVHDQQLNSYKLQSMLFQKQIDDETIYELMESINAVLKKIVEIPTGKVVFYITADNQSRNKALEMGLKLHKKLTDKVEVKDTTPYTGLTDAELHERIKKGKNFFLKK